MSDMEVAPDPIVRTALQHLPIPQHTDAFWTALDDVLVEAGAPRSQARIDERKVVVVPDPPESSAAVAAPTALPAPSDPSLALVPPALRRTSNGLLLAVAAAAAVVVLLAGVSLLDDRHGTSSGSSDDLAAPTIETIDRTQSEDAVPASLSAASEEASTDAVLAWVDDIDDGDGAGAWDAMGATSRAHFHTQDEFEAEMSTISATYSGWAAAEPEDVIVTPVRSSEAETIAVVTLVGAVEDADGRRRVTEAFPVRVVDGDVVLEPFALAGALEMVVPSLGADGEVPPTVAPDDALVIVVPSGAAAPILRLDEGEAVVCGASEGTELTDLEGSSGQRCAYAPEAGMDPGEHTLTMAFMGSDGESISAESVLFEAA